jgi:hypothetical protein
MPRKATQILAAAGLIISSLAGLAAAPAIAQSTPACRDACRATYGGGRDNQEYLDCVEICSQGTTAPPGGGGTSPIGDGCAYDSCSYPGTKKPS